MGCDIHIHLEYKLKNNNGDFNSWTVSPLRIDANYEMFALMADVRNEDGKFTPVAKPRGIPFDASYLTKVHYRNERNDAHSMSWLSSREFGEVLQRYSDDDLCPDYRALYGAMQALEEQECFDVRIVFWFDC